MNTNRHTDQILLVSASERRFELQAALADSLKAPVSVASSFSEALSAIALTPRRAVILDEGMMDLDPASGEQFLARCNDELPIYVKLAISGVPRCLQQVHLALRRFEREQQIAAASAQNLMRSEMRDALTSILLCGQLALKTPQLPEDAARHLEAILEAGQILQQSLSPSRE